VENECGEIPTIIVQNKIDLMDQCVVGPDEAELVARALGCRLMRASVKEDVNVGAVFRALAARCLADMRRENAADMTTPTIAPVIGTFTNHNSNGTILLRPVKHRPGDMVYYNRDLLEACSVPFTPESLRAACSHHYSSYYSSATFQKRSVSIDGTAEDKI
ncbi:unnamed protein product, partial [Leptosia nina]